MKKIKKITIISVSVLVAIFLVLFWFSWGDNSSSKEIYSQNTKFRLFGADNSISTSYFADPDLPGVHCYITRANQGGVSGSLGVAEDSGHATLSCFQASKIDTTNLSEEPKDIYKERRSIGFKKLRVVRYYIKNNNDLVYVTYSDAIMDGDNENSSTGFHINNNIFK